MKVKIPKEIKIGTLDYTITLDPYIWKEDAQKGQVNYMKLTIKLDPQIPESQRSLTLIHEVIHIVCDNYNVHLDEDDVDRLAHGIGEFLFNNLDIEFDWSEFT